MAARHRVASGHMRSVFIAAMILAVPMFAVASERFFTAVGEDAAAFELPSDVTLARSSHLVRSGLTIERYQQTYEGAHVLGGQITIHRDESGNVVRVGGPIMPTSHHQTACASPPRGREVSLIATSARKGPAT